MQWYYLSNRTNLLLHCLLKHWILKLQFCDYFLTVQFPKCQSKTRFGLFSRTTTSLLPVNIVLLLFKPTTWQCGSSNYKAINSRCPIFFQNQGPQFALSVINFELTSWTCCLILSFRFSRSLGLFSESHRWGTCTNTTL